MSKYGLPYMGSKDKIADWIMEQLPAGKRFVDLFGGGFAMSHCALLSGKYESIYYNELNPLLEPLIRDAVAGKYNWDNFKPEWITREKFQELKDADGYVRYIWSFGNKGDSYMFGEQIEDWKQAFFMAVFGDYSFFNKMNIFPPEFQGNPHDRRILLARWIKSNMIELKAKYIKYYCEKIDVKKRDIETILGFVVKDVQGELKHEKEKLQEYLRTALRNSNITASEVDRRLGCQMSNHYFGNSQWAFPTLEMYKAMQKFMPALDRDYFEVTNYMTILQSLQSLGSLQILESLLSLERLQRLESLQSLELHTGSYLDYKYQDGDVVYCDPPYENTTGYNKDCFNHKEFYDWVASRPYTVYFSSYEISDNRFFVIGEKEKANLLKAGGADKKSIEKLYCNKPVITHQLNYQYTIFDYL